MDLGTIGISIETIGSEQAIQNVRDYVATINNAAGVSTVYTERLTKMAEIRERINSKEVRDNMAYTRTVMSLARQREAAKKAEVDREIAQANRIEKQYLRLSEMMDPSIRANNEYAASIDIVTNARNRGIISAEEEIRVTKQLERHRIAAANGLNQYTRDARGAVQQLGYQVADFAVQIQSGTNPLVALAQQGSQVLAMFGAGGAVAGALLAVGGAIATMFVESWQEAKTLTEQIDELSNAVDRVNKANENYTTDGIEDLIKKYGVLDEQVKSLVANETLYSQLLAKKEAKEAMAGIAAVAGPSFYHIGVSDYASSLINLRSEFKLTMNDAKALKYAFDEVGKVKGEGYDEQAEALSRLSDYLGVVLSNQKNVTSSQLELYENVNRALAATKELANSSPKSNWLDPAIESLSRFITALSDAATAKDSLFSRISIPTPVGLIPIRSITGGSGVGGAGDTRMGMGSGSSGSGSSGSGSSGSGSSGSTISEYNFSSPSIGTSDPMSRLRSQIKLETELLNLTESQRRVQQALGEERSKYSESEIASITSEIDAMLSKQKVMQQEQGLADSIKSSMESSFNSMMDGTKSVEDSFKDMARSIIAELYNVLVVQQIVGSWNATTKTGNGILGWIFKAFQADGGAWENGVQKFANGGVVSGPTTFGMSGGGMGLMGEAGPEAIMPLKRGPDGKLGVGASVSGGDNLTINNNINVTGSDAASVRQEVLKMLPQISEVTKAAVLQARKRGGAYRDTFR